MTKYTWLFQSAICSYFALASILLSAVGYAQNNPIHAQKTAQNPRFVYIPGGQGDSRVFQYRIGADGKRRPLSPPSVTVHGSAYSVVIAPNRRSVYVPEGDYMNVAQFHVRSDGTLAPLRHPEIAADSHPSAMVFSSNGRNAYVSCSHGDVCQYRVRADGSLYPLSPPTVSIRPSAIHDSGLRDPSPVAFQQNGHRASVLAEWDDGTSGKPMWYEFQYRVRHNGRLVLLRVARVSR